MLLTRVIGTMVVRSSIFLRALKTYRDPVKTFRAIGKLIKKRVAFGGTGGMPQFFFSCGRFFFDPNIPGWPSTAFNKFILNELNNSAPFTAGRSRLSTVIFSITKRCPLKCKHCFEWERLDGKESLSRHDLKNALGSLQEYGVSHIQLGGGEPMSRFDDLLRLLDSSQPGTDFWLLTSGYDITYEKALLLKKAGLTGVRISLDNYDPEQHNAFRGSEKAFEWAVSAVENCRKARLVTGLSLCITRELLTIGNLYSYLAFARKLKVSFIFLLEPRETGHFKDSKATLTTGEIKLVEDFFIKTITKKSFDFNPRVYYPGYYQRRIGCFGAGIRYLYLDSEGSAHSCPFCQGKKGSILADSMTDIIQNLKQSGCQMYQTDELSFAR